jgi:hypothetical protein
MPFTKASSSQHPHYDAVGCVLNVRGKPFGLLVSSESAVELLEFNTQRWWPLPSISSDNSTDESTDDTEETSNHRREATSTSSSTNHRHRGASAVASVGSQVYQVGGLDTTNNAINYSSKACHSFEFGATTWQSLPEMKQGRCYPAAIGLGNDDDGDTNNPSTLYVLGGRDGWDELNTVEAFHVATQTWTPKARFATPRMAPAVAALNETTLLLVGGYTGQQWTTSVELYSVPTNSWNTDKKWKIPSLPVALAFPKAIIVPGKKAGDDDEFNNINRILIVGTSILTPKSGNSTYTVILSYQFKIGKWSKLVSGVTRRSGKIALPIEGCAVVLDPDQTTLYTIGGRTSTRQLETASKQVLKWNLPKGTNDDAAWIQNLQPPLVSPRRSRRPSMSGSVTSGIPFSTIQVDGDEQSESGSSMAGTLFSLVSPRRPGFERTRSTMDMLNASIPIMEGHEEDSQEETTTIKDPMEWTDANGKQGKYAGKVKRSNAETPHGMGQFVTRETSDCYEGGWKHGKRHDYGRLKYGATGEVFEGWFEKDKKQGRGTFQVSDGDARNTTMCILFHTGMQEEYLFIHVLFHFSGPTGVNSKDTMPMTWPKIPMQLLPGRMGLYLWEALPKAYGPERA